jgi:hypothetical protein
MTGEAHRHGRLAGRVTAENGMDDASANKAEREALRVELDG